jgi:ubiquitin carboxyl-terminal hydrolase 5/13
MTKLAVVEEREEDKYEHTLAFRHYRASAAATTALDSSNTIFVPVEGIAQTNPHVRALVDGVMKSLSSGRQSEVKAWEEELLPCEHILMLDQLATGHIPASGACSILLFILRLRSEPARWGMMGY